MVQVADVDASTETEDALALAPAYLEGQPGTIDCINVSCDARWLCFHRLKIATTHHPVQLWSAKSAFDRHACMGECLL
jgi:hypothetical protein